MNERIYVQTNDAERNEVIAFDRSGDGRLSLLGRYDTGGRGTGKPHLASQSSVVLSDDGKQYVHAHPADDKPGGGNVVTFQAHFTRAGLYKGWGQFRWKDQIRVVPFVVKVE